MSNFEFGVPTVSAAKRQKASSACARRKFLDRDGPSVAFLGSYRERVTTVRTVLGQVPVHFVQEGLAALIVLDRKARDLIIDRFGVSSIGTQTRYAVRALVLDARAVLYFVVVLRQTQAPEGEPTGTVR